jgi:hypothetical protein
MAMRRNYGQFVHGGTTYIVYESDQKVNTSVQQFTLPTQMNQKKFDDLFGGEGGDKTTVVKTGADRLDKQNQNIGLVTFPGVQGKQFNNLSVQRSDASVAVLFLQDGLIESYIGSAGVGDLRGMFAHLRGNNYNREEKQLLRILYTWLAISNAVGFKICITDSLINAQGGALNPVLAGDHSTTKKQWAVAKIP